MEDKVLETIMNGVGYTPLKDILVKPLEPIMVTKEFTSPSPTGEKDEQGFEKYDTITETKEVESEWAEGIVLLIGKDIKDLPLAEGDTVVYCRKFAKDFDLFKNSQLVKPYDIVAVKSK